MVCRMAILLKTISSVPSKSRNEDGEKVTKGGNASTAYFCLVLAVSRCYPKDISKKRGSIFSKEKFWK